MEKTVPQDNNWPFSPYDGERHSDIAVANIISSALACGSAESHLIWQRYSAMLIANGIFLGFLLRTIGNDVQCIVSSVVKLFGCVIGICLCLIWRRLTANGWNLHRIWVDYVDSVDFESFPIPNPVRYYRNKRESGLKNTIFKPAILVIWIFIISYSFSALFIIGWLMNFWSA